LKVKSKNMKEIFDIVMDTVSDENAAKKTIQKLLIRSYAERNFSSNEFIHLTTGKNYTLHLGPLWKWFSKIINENKSDLDHWILFIMKILFYSHHWKFIHFSQSNVLILLYNSLKEKFSNKIVGLRQSLE
jgi:hypothetical protein